MLSPTTFPGVAKATSVAGQPPLAGTQRGLVQPVRVLGTPLPAPLMPGLAAKPSIAASPQTAPAPPRNLPRGSLLDLSV
jgi:hypothetical protein